MKDQVTLYIVDDEIMAINYFKTLVKQASPHYEVVGEAFNGAMALPEILRLKPDIIFIDIKMPIMDGLELSEKVLEVNNAQKIVLLTSYRDFDYIKQGMRLGINSYLLKNELNQILLKDEIEKIIAQRHLERKKVHSYTEYNLKTFLASSHMDSEMKHLYLERPMQRYALIYILRNQPITLDYYVLPSVEIDILEIEDLVFSEGLFCRNAISITETSWCGIYFIDTQVGDSQILLEEACFKIKDYFNHQGIDVSCILSEATYNFFNLPTIYQRIEAKGFYSFFYGSNQVLREKQVPLRDRDTFKYETYFIHFIEAVEKNDYVQSKDDLSQLLNGCLVNYNHYEYTEVLKEIRNFLRRCMEKQKLDINLFHPKAIFGSQKEIEAYFFNCLDQLFKNTKLQNEAQYSRKIVGALAYIYKNYHQNISVQDIADAVHLSEGHLRKCFKNELDTTVVDFLTSYRVQKAKEFMREGNNKIATICKKTGFMSSQYFSYVFKKIEGVSPSEYVKKL